MSLRERAKKLVSVSDIVAGREKVDVEKVIATHPDGFTVVDFDIIEDRKNDDEYAAVVMEEDPKSFFFAGLALTGFFKDLCEEYGSKEAAREAVQQEGLAIKLVQRRSKNNRTYTGYELL